ncbi:MAG TPA: EscU/YscU/HrcU family type III secretion system export apparatus switch protein, partial [Turneriella sp.]|nr:EscU/YscU/HrcU family type III secretion system export apparatus switch protein [Turneriella sp.]
MSHHDFPKNLSDLPAEGKLFFLTVQSLRIMSHYSVWIYFLIILWRQIRLFFYSRFDFLFSDIKIISSAGEIPLRVVDIYSLSMFAAEDEGRTEDPTELRKRREREKGRVAKSAEIPAALGTLGGLIVLFISAGWVLSSIARMVKIYVGNFSSLGKIEEATIITLMVNLSRDFFIMLAPFFAAVMLLGIVGNISQTGFLFSLEPLRPKFSNISFTFNRMIERVFLSKQIYVNLTKTIIKVIAIGFVSYLIISDDFLSIMKTGSVGVGEALRSLGSMSFKLALILVIILLLMSIPDYIFQRSQFIESLKMTKQEVKQEFREQEGDPQIKARQRQRMQEALRTQMRQAVQTADIVITNPTHYAVAIKFEFDVEGTPPKLVAKGEDEVARIIREIAKANEVPIVEDKPLARFIYDNIELNQLLPENLLALLARIVAALPALRAKFNRGQAVA